MLWIYLLLVIVPSHSLTLYLPNSTHYLDSIYSTIGNAPQFPTNFTIHIVNKSDLQGGCAPLTRQASTLTGKVLVYNGDIWQPKLFHTCVYNDYPLGLLFTSWAQDVGAVGVINRGKPGEHYVGGRVIGFNSDIKIPYIITSPENVDYLVANQDLISYVELPPKTMADIREIQHLKNVYNGLVHLNIAVYSILLMLLGYLVITEMIDFAKMRKVKYHRISLVTACFINCILLFIWNIVDPYSYKLVNRFPSLPIYLLSLGCTLIIFMLILKIWVKATGESLVSKRVRIILKIIHTGAGILALVTVITAALWYESAMIIVFTIVMYAAAVGSAIGFIYYGRNIANILRSSGNSNKLSTCLMSSRIIISAATNTVATIIILVLFQTPVLGGTITVQIGVFVTVFALFATFLLLFFKLRVRKERIRRLSEVGQPPPTPSPTVTSSGSSSSPSNTATV